MSTKKLPKSQMKKALFGCLQNVKLSYIFAFFYDLEPLIDMYFKSLTSRKVCEWQPKQVVRYFGHRLLQSTDPIRTYILHFQLYGAEDLYLHEMF